MDVLKFTRLVLVEKDAYAAYRGKVLVGKVKGEMTPEQLEYFRKYPLNVLDDIDNEPETA